jgi:hypothetical protein
MALLGFWTGAFVTTLVHQSKAATNAAIQTGGHIDLATDFGLLTTD